MKILITTSTFGQQNSEPLHRLSREGFDIVLNPYKRRMTEQELVPLLKDTLGVIAGTEYWGEPLFANAPRLKVLSRCGSGLDTVDLTSARKHGITVVSTPEAPVEGVAELTVALLLGCLRHIGQANQAMRQGVWKPFMGQLLHGKTVGLIGLGRIGRRMVELLTPYDVRFLAREKSPIRSFVKEHDIHLVDLNTLVKESDIVSLHITLDPETRGIIDAASIQQMKANAILLNTSRGELVDDHALAEALQSGRIAGAGIDVFPVEPYAGPLVKCDTALLSCHMGSYANETRMRMEQQAVDNLIAALGS